MKIYRHCFFLVFSILALVTHTQDALAQSSVAQKATDRPDKLSGIEGVNSDQAYEELLTNRTATSVIVAVIDGGVDPEHEDLKSVMWTNEDEIPDNNIDDDGNGYVDDIHGWNFIGGPEENVEYDTYGLTREYQELLKKYGNADSTKLNKKSLVAYNRMRELEAIIDRKRSNAEEKYQEFSQIVTFVEFAIDQAIAMIGDVPVASIDVDSMDIDNPIIKQFLQEVLPQTAGYEGSLSELRDDILYDYKLAAEDQMAKAKYNYNVDYDPRFIVQDDITDVKQRYYGNPDVKGPDAYHGTHVAGIIAADRDNDLGIRGVAENVQIMAVRAIPDGDERDKDVANAIIYAVDNGASIINMSFGKGYSPHEKEVDRAIRYAEKNDVLLIAAAGNDAQDIDVILHHPEPVYSKRRLFQPKKAKNWIHVGALTWEMDENAVAGFSNYGKNSVHIFAPGSQILSTAPDQEYRESSGTSMAAPAVSGVAAILRSYFPQLSAREIKDILLESSSRIQHEVIHPASGEMVPMTDLCTTGGTVDAYEAVQFALTKLQANSR